MPTPLIVTGCPRSGTTTMANVLGILHEQQFDVLNAAISTADMSPVRSECAWPAAPFAHLLLQRGLRVLHLVRNPLDTIASMMTREMFVRVDHVSDLFIRQHVKVLHGGTQLEMCATVWVAWNEMLDRLDVPRIRIEDIGNAPRKHVGPKVPPIKRGDLEDNKLWNQVVDLGRRYGYTLQ